MKLPAWLLDSKPCYCKRRRWHFRVCEILDRRETLTALWGFHWLVQLAVWIQHQWAAAALAPSLLEKWTGRRLAKNCERTGHRFEHRGTGLCDGTVYFHQCIDCGAPHPRGGSGGPG